MNWDKLIAFPLNETCRSEPSMFKKIYPCTARWQVRYLDPDGSERDDRRMDDPCWKSKGPKSLTKLSVHYLKCPQSFIGFQLCNWKLIRILCNDLTFPAPVVVNFSIFVPTHTKIVLQGALFAWFKWNFPFFLRNDCSLWDFILKYSFVVEK